MKLTPTALQLKKFSIIGHSMGECSFTSEFIVNCVMHYCCIMKSYEAAAGPVFIYRWRHRWTGQCFIRALMHLILLWLTTNGVFWCSTNMLCFPQFSALYPEMVDALILLDTLVLLPTDTVITIVYNPGFDSQKHLFGLFVIAIILFLNLSVWDSRFFYLLCCMVQILKSLKQFCLI